MDRSNARTMEFYRRIGIVDRVRALGYPPDNPMDVFLATRLSDPPIAVLKYPSVAERRKQIAEIAERRLAAGALPAGVAEQARAAAEGSGGRHAECHRPLRLRADRFRAGRERRDHRRAHRRWTASETLRCAYLAGCDGGSSTVRKKLGIKLEGRGSIRELVQIIFRSEDLYERIVTGKGRHYQFRRRRRIDHRRTGDRKEFTLHSSLPADTDFRPVIQDLIGFPCDFEILHVIPWRHHLLVAERYRDRRVFLAGDAVHLVIPAGGLGMNTGVGDAFDLSWKLAGTIKGWGGPGLLDGYEQERRPIGVRNVAAAGWAAEGVPIWRALVTPAVYDDTPEGEAKRRELAASFDVNHRRMHGMVGVEAGYSYAGSPLIADEPGNVAEWETSRYVPHARPGVRIPHMWLKDGRALQDVLGNDYTLLDLRGDCDATSACGGVPRSGRTARSSPSGRGAGASTSMALRFSCCARTFTIVWRGDGPPPGPAALAALATGRTSNRR